MIIGGEKRKNLVYKKRKMYYSVRNKIMKEKSKSVITFLIDIQ